MLRRNKKFTLCSPIPAFIPHRLAIDVLRNHGQVITLNPLVIDYAQIKTPSRAASDERNCAWYAVTARIHYIPAFGRVGAGTIRFKGCFHDMPWGLKTHIYAPMDVDLRVQYRVEGTQTGMELEGPREFGFTEIGAPQSGLYLRTDVEFSSNVVLVGFIRKQLQAAIKEMVDRILEKAEMLDADILESTINEEKSSRRALVKTGSAN